MTSADVNYLAQQLIYQGPLLLVAGAGFLLSLVFMGRYRWPSVLTLLGTMILLIATLGVVFAQIYFSAQGNPGLAIEASRQLQAAMVIAGSLLRGLGIALILVAVFIARKPHAGRVP
jgi:hypothetical protein